MSSVFKPASILLPTDRKCKSRLIRLTATVAALLSIASQVVARAEPPFVVGAREVVATKAQREALGLNWFFDGNLGVVKDGAKYAMYGANSVRPFRTTGTWEAPFQKVEPVTISTTASNFAYLSGGPVYRDPTSGRLLLFYHAEIHRGSQENFYAVLGLAIQTDTAGLAFKDLGPVFVPNVPNEQARSAIEICGAPYVIKDGYFYVYARDEMLNVKPQQSNLSVVRARVEDVVKSALQGKSAEWKKYYQGSFCQPALGGKSSSLENGNPGTRWMDVSYNSALNRFILVVAANTAPDKVELFIAFSNDGIHWTKRKQLTDEVGESFYPSIVGGNDDPRQTGKEFYVYYTSSKKGGFERWTDAELLRRKITFTSR